MLVDGSKERQRRFLSPARGKKVFNTHNERWLFFKYKLSNIGGILMCDNTLMGCKIMKTSENGLYFACTPVLSLYFVLGRPLAAACFN